VRSDARRWGRALRALLAALALAGTTTPAFAVPVDVARGEGAEPASAEARQAEERTTGERLTMALLALLGAGFLLVPLALNAGSREALVGGTWAVRRLRRGEPTPEGSVEVPRDHGADVREALTSLGATDEAFSGPVFARFVKLLVEKVLVEEGAARRTLAPYLVPLLGGKRTDDELATLLGCRARKLAFRRQLPALTKAARTAPLPEVLVADVQVTHAASIAAPKRAVRVAVEVTLLARVADTPTTADPSEALRVLRETWVFSRSPDAPSRAPDEVGQLGCPSCDRPWDETAQAQTNGRCPSCDARVRSPLHSGDFDWVLCSVEVPRHSEAWLPTAGSHEVGTDLPTVIDPRLGLRHQALREGVRGFVWERFTEEVRELFARLLVVGDEGGAATIGHVARWRGLDVAVTDGFLADEAAREALLATQGLTETIKSARVCSLQLVGVESDRFFERVTVRLYAAGYFALIAGLDPDRPETSGTVVSGSRHQERVYSEYWTFLRERQASRPAEGATSSGGSGFRLEHRRADEAQRAPT
jgi:hypothetical protein